MTISKRCSSKFVIGLTLGMVFLVLAGCDSANQTSAKSTTPVDYETAKVSKHDAAYAADQVFMEQPIIVANPSGRVPLAAELKFSTNSQATPIVTISDGERSWNVPDSVIAADSGHYAIPIVGMKANREHQINLVLKQAEEVVF